MSRWLREQGHDVTDLGTNGPESVDYPEFGAQTGRCDCLGRSRAWHRRMRLGHRHFDRRQPRARCRCARVDDPLSAQLAREHNDANVLALGARLIGSDMAKACVAAFLGTDFAGGRHQRRVDQLSQLLQDSD